MNLTLLFTGLFIVLIVYILVFTFKDSDDVINNSYNKREELFTDKVSRGEILSYDGKVLAKTVNQGTSDEKREYPYGRIFAHIVGFNTHGKSGLESAYNYTLLKSNTIITERINNSLHDKKNIGDNIVTTLNVKMQEAAYNGLSNYKGAVIAMDAETFEILCAVSKPDFDPNSISETWNSLNSDTVNSPLINRVFQGQYPPGSTFKIITTLEYLKENSNINDYSFDCQGSFTYDNCKINCYHGISHGEEDFIKSFAKSCNSSFANMTSGFNKESFKETCDDLMFNKALISPLSVKQSNVAINKNSSTDELLQTGIGQGNTRVSPYHMCLITAGIANNGIIKKPELIKRVETSGGDLVRSPINLYSKRIMSKSSAETVKNLMRQVVLDGTATKIKNTENYEVYGKTGSAEYNSNKKMSHAWFTCVGENENKKIAVTVIAEEAGSGGEVAVPIAKKVLDAYFN